MVLTPAHQPINRAADSSLKTITPVTAERQSMDIQSKPHIPTNNILLLDFNNNSAPHEHGQIMDFTAEISQQLPPTDQSPLNNNTTSKGLPKKWTRRPTKSTGSTSSKITPAQPNQQEHIKRTRQPEISQSSNRLPHSSRLKPMALNPVTGFRIPW
ncbi:hypothetical protein STAS_28669 [Striga asiatica]|uniref:Uncharacterized protein n=1 Tax=Striga asiatica TaxID=4170 RepID=A0A5A7R0P8_STRAF|nr:hypothetical protein STAS_28669 [Striga asiatica]